MKIRYKKSTMKKVIIITITLLVAIFYKNIKTKIYTYTCKE